MAGASYLKKKGLSGAFCAWIKTLTNDLSAELPPPFRGGVGWGGVGTVKGSLGRDVRPPRPSNPDPD